MKIAGVQMDVAFGEVTKNVEVVIASLEETAAAGSKLTVFPECALSGYCFESLEEAIPHAVEVPGPETEQIAAACQRLNVSAVVGMLEKVGEHVFNSAVLFRPTGIAGCYRKVHLPFLGVDRFTTPGDQPYETFSTGEANIGLQICYDASFPEATRSLTIAGADIVALPTNWPPGAETTAEHCINSRAVENGIYFIAINRAGRERGFQFIGRSSICDPFGNTLAKAETKEREVLYAEIDLERARNKRYQRVPGKHEIDRLADRRPEMYTPIIEPHTLSTPHAEHLP